MEKVINGLIELSEMVKTAIAMAKNDEDLNSILRSISCKQLCICADHFDYVFNKSSKKIGEILENEEQEII
jgi:hypothetical protein